MFKSIIMKQFTVLAIFCLFSTSKVIGQQEECPPDGISYLPDVDCTIYYICVNGEAIEQSCPDSFYFNPSTHACDFPENVPECVGGTRPPVTPEPEPTEPIPTSTTTSPTTTPTTSKPSSTTPPTPEPEPTEPTETLPTAVTEPTEPTTEAPPSNIIRNCGDTIVANEGTVEYKLNVTYMDNERCAFIVRTFNHTGFLFTLEENGFVDDSTLQGGSISLFGFGSKGISDSSHLGLPNPLNTTFVQGSVVVIIFKSEAYTGTGFRLSFQAIGEVLSGIDNYDDLIYSNNTGTMRYPATGNYLPNSGSVFIISNNYRRIGSLYESLHLNISRIDMEICGENCLCDYLMVYSLDQESLLNELERACQATNLREFDTRGIFVLFFKSNYALSGAGFTLDWLVQDDSF